jgi:SanA protein
VTATHPKSLNEARQWFREAGFGLFIHWGLYAIPAGSWKGSEVAFLGEWIMNTARIPVREYERLARWFNPAAFNAREWVQMAEAAGMRYLVFTSKHHDGFAMFRSDADPYNVVGATPFKRDAAMTLKTVLRAVRDALAWRHWTWRRVGWACVWLAGAGVLAVVAAAAEIRLAAKGRTYSTVEEIPHRRVGLVLGCSRTLPDGRRNLYFITRMNAAAGLFKARKVDYLIVSGDNHVKGYDEPTDMKQALADAGVPTNRVYCDYAGFRTLDSVVRANEVFGQTHVTVISQQFHNERAIYIAGRRGVDAIGYNAEDVRSIHRLRTMLREQLARVKTVLDVTLLRARPKFLGPRVEVGVTVQSPQKTLVSLGK